eukprot:6497969-Karenia_brevis.AAC.1
MAPFPTLNVNGSIEELFQILEHVRLLLHGLAGSAGHSLRCIGEPWRVLHPGHNMHVNRAT